MSQISQSDTQTVSDVVRNLRSIAIHSLARMYRPEQRLFAFRLRRDGQGDVLEGVSRRMLSMNACFCDELIYSSSTLCKAVQIFK